MNDMTDTQKQWAVCRDELVRAMAEAGYPREVALEIAKMLGVPKSIARMASYVRNVRPLSMEMIADEALSIKSDADRWRERKISLEANRKYNEMLNSGLGEEE
ncbi:MAG: hypothetical protein IKP75_02050 [Oscillospiraceae bacterium]|nr:hypothetical protein [Oscillospiraceae bacterium]